MPRRSCASRLVCMGLSLLLLLPLVLQVRAEPLPWANRELYYEAKNEPLSEMLRALCLRHNTAAVLSPNISGEVNGIFRFARASDFLDSISKAHGISWYYNGVAVYFDKLEEHRNAMVRLRWMSPAQLRATLRAMGVLDARFPWRAHEDQRLINISGPPQYVETILGLINNIDSHAAQDMQMQVFRLKHARADDFTIDSHHTTMTIPGVATLLRTITGDHGISSASAPRSTNPVGLRGQGLVRNSSNQRESAAFEPVETTAALISSARILADSRLNAVVVWDTRDRMEQYARTIQQLDQPVELVEIQVAILEVNVNRVSELGLSWAGNIRISDHVNIVGGVNVGPPTSPVDFRSPYGSGMNISTIYTHGLDVLMTRVHALEATGDAAVLSRPKVLTLDNMQASLEHVSTFYVRVAGYEQVDLFDITYGTVLRVTPHVERSESGAAIRMFIQVDDGNTTSGEVDQVPIVGRSSIKTQAVVNENQALVIGGYYYEKSLADVSGAPVLMNIPILGYLFKTDTNTVQKIERLFAIAPRLVNLAELTASQQVPEEAFTRDLQLAQHYPPQPSSGGCTRKRSGTEL